MFLYFGQRVGKSMYLDPNPDPSGGGGTGTEDKNKGKGGPSGGGYNPNMTDDELTQRARRIVAQKGRGDIMRALKLVLSENAKVRSKNDELARRVGELEKGGINEEDRKLLDAAKKHKLTVEGVDTLIKEHGELKAKDSENTYRTNVNKAGEFLGLHNDAVAILGDQLMLRKQHLEFRDIHVQEKDKTVVKSVPHVRPSSDDKAALVPLSEWVTNELKPYKEVFSKKRESSASSSSSESSSGMSFIEFPEQSPADKAPQQGRAVDNHMRATFGDLSWLPGQPAPTGGQPSRQGA